MLSRLCRAAPHSLRGDPSTGEYSGRRDLDARTSRPKPALPLFENPDWAKGYDIVIHDECAALNENARLMENILKAHETIPSVQLHCAMHSFRGRGNSRETFTAKGHHDWCKRIGPALDEATARTFRYRWRSSMRNTRSQNL